MRNVYRDEFSLDEALDGTTFLSITQGYIVLGQLRHNRLGVAGSLLEDSWDSRFEESGNCALGQSRSAKRFQGSAVVSL